MTHSDNKGLLGSKEGREFSQLWEGLQNQTLLYAEGFSQDGPSCSTQREAGEMRGGDGQHASTGHVCYATGLGHTFSRYGPETLTHEVETIFIICFSHFHSLTRVIAEFSRGNMTYSIATDPVHKQI